MRLKERNQKELIKVKVQTIPVEILVRIQTMCLEFQSIQNRIKTLLIRKVIDLLKTPKLLENQILWRRNRTLSINRIKTLSWTKMNPKQTKQNEIDLNNQINDPKSFETLLISKEV